MSRRLVLCITNTSNVRNQAVYVSPKLAAFNTYCSHLDTLILQSFSSVTCLQIDNVRRALTHEQLRLHPAQTKPNIRELSVGSFKYRVQSSGFGVCPFFH